MLFYGLWKSFAVPALPASFRVGVSVVSGPWHLHELFAGHLCSVGLVAAGGRVGMLEDDGIGNLHGHMFKHISN